MIIKLRNNEFIGTRNGGIQTGDHRITKLQLCHLSHRISLLKDNLTDSTVLEKWVTTSIIVLFLQGLKYRGGKLKQFTKEKKISEQKQVWVILIFCRKKMKHKLFLCTLLSFKINFFLTFTHTEQRKKILWRKFIQLQVTIFNSRGGWVV